MAKRIINRASPQAKGLVAYYPCDEHGGMVLEDLASAMNNGTVYGSTSILSNNAYQCQNSGDYVDCGNRSDVKMTSAFTIAFWCRRPTAGTFISVGKHDGSPQKSYVIVWNSADNRWYFVLSSTGSNDLYCYTAAYSNLNWMHVAAVYDGSLGTGTAKMRLYFNGISQNLTVAGTLPTTIYQNTANFKIGKYDSVPSYSKGYFRDVRLYNLPLSQTEVIDIYNYPNKLYVK